MYNVHWKYLKIICVYDQVSNMFVIQYMLRMRRVHAACIFITTQCSLQRELHANSFIALLLL